MSTKIEVESYNEVTNARVLRLPERQFPGVLVQGDTLFTLLQTAQELQNDQPSHEAVSELVDRLSGLIAVYEEALSAEGMKLPYFKP